MLKHDAVSMKVNECKIYGIYCDYRLEGCGSIKAYRCLIRYFSQSGSLSLSNNLFTSAKQFTSSFSLYKVVQI